MRKKINNSLIITEILMIRSALNLSWDEFVKKNCPKEVAKDLNKYHQWVRIQEKDRMTNIYWIQRIREKLIEMERLQ